MKLIAFGPKSRLSSSAMRVRVRPGVAVGLGADAVERGGAWLETGCGARCAVHANVVHANEMAKTAARVSRMCCPLPFRHGQRAKRCRAAFKAGATIKVESRVGASREFADQLEQAKSA
jgi:hypothetical protein